MSARIFSKRNPQSVMPTEADSCRKFVVPKLQIAGRDSDPHSIAEQGKPGLNLGNIRSLALPFPSIAEQRRIVAELDALQAEVDALKRLQAETAAELDALLPAILDCAFKGEL